MKPIKVKLKKVGKKWIIILGVIVLVVIIIYKVSTNPVVTQLIEEYKSNGVQ